VIQDVRASKGIIVARKGFSNTAMKKASRLGITLLRADRLSNLGQTAVDVPIHVREVKQTKVSVAGVLRPDVHTRVDRTAIWHLNDLDLRRLLRDEILKDPSRRQVGRHIWQAEGLEPPWFIRDVNGRAMQLDDLQLSYEVQEKHFFGYLGALDEVLYLRDDIERSQPSSFLWNRWDSTIRSASLNLIV
jgi:hypothetical protein